MVIMSKGWRNGSSPKRGMIVPTQFISASPTSPPATPSGMVVMISSG